MSGRRGCGHPRRLLVDTQISRYRMPFAREVAMAGAGQYVRVEQLEADTLARLGRLGPSMGGWRGAHNPMRAPSRLRASRPGRTERSRRVLGQLLVDLAPQQASELPPGVVQSSVDRILRHARGQRDFGCGQSKSIMGKSGDAQGLAQPGHRRQHG